MIYKDPNMTHPAVLMYREKFHKCPNRGLRQDIVVTVTDLSLWLSVLNGWRYQIQDRWKAKNPMAVKEMLTEYERISMNGVQSEGNRVHREESLPPGPERGMSKSGLPTLLARSRM